MTARSKHDVYDGLLEAMRALSRATGGPVAVVAETGAGEQGLIGCIHVGQTPPPTRDDMMQMLLQAYAVLRDGVEQAATTITTPHRN